MAAQTAPCNDNLKLAFNGHCRECHSFVTDLGKPYMAWWAGRLGRFPTSLILKSVKGSGITWDEPTLDKWITNPNALIPGNNMGANFSGKKIISFLKQDTQTAAPAPGLPKASQQPN